MRSVALMKTAKIGYIIMSAAMCALGIILIAAPGFSISAFGVIAGILMIVFGIVKLVGYFSKDLFRLAFQYDLASGILLIALGIITVIRPQELMNFLCAALGIMLMADGLLKVQTALDAKKFGIKKWWLILAAAIVVFALGTLLIFRSNESARVITVILGTALLAEGVLNFSTVLTAVKIIKHQKPDIIDADFIIERED